MEWVLKSPQIHSTFGSLGYIKADGYHVNENCNAALETILENILTEDKYLRTYRRSISFGQNIDKDIIPLLINAKEDSTIQLLIKILVNLTIPVECLLSVEVISKTNYGRHTVFEINNLLAAAKTAFVDSRASKVLLDFLKKNVEFDQKGKMSEEQRANITNSLLLLRNILHIPDETISLNPNYNGNAHTVQNQIIWNIFSQSIDKIIITLITIPEATYWSVTMVQLVALLYKDQHVVSLHKLLNLWLEAAVSDSSEDNESNTSPPDRGSDSSPITSDPTSDSSDIGISGNCSGDTLRDVGSWESVLKSATDSQSDCLVFQPPPPPPPVKHKTKPSDNTPVIKSESAYIKNKEFSLVDRKTLVSDNSNCGYGTQMEKESNSTSSNEDDIPEKKPHQKPHNTKQRPNNKTRTVTITVQDKKRKKLVKRGKANIINVQGLTHNTPTDDDISNVLKEFTVDFLLKGYNALVQTLHTQILANIELEIDKSHFFWLVTYFLKFASQIELDLEHICSVLSFDIVSYLTAEGVNLCEQFELAIKIDGNDLKPIIRRLHLVVTAIREFVQAVEVYKKFTHLGPQDRQTLFELQVKMYETEELRSLLILLLRHYNPKYHTKQYLQDLIVTNHILLMFVDNVTKLPNYTSSGTDMSQHIRQFASPEIMIRYGLLLEDYEDNGEFVNDCIFTVMHHVGGGLGCVEALFQPEILKTFSYISKSEYEICDDWSDLIEFVINTFLKQPESYKRSFSSQLDIACFNNMKLPKLLPSHMLEGQKNEDNGLKIQNAPIGTEVVSSYEKWTEEEQSSLSWKYMQCSLSSDVLGDVVKIFREEGVIKSRISVLRELLRQNLVTQAEHENLAKNEIERSSMTVSVEKENKENEDDIVCELLAQYDKTNTLGWVQNILLETCFVKVNLDKKSQSLDKVEKKDKEVKFFNFELFKKKANNLPAMFPVSYHCLIHNQSVPLVPWNCEQATLCNDLKFLQLIHRLGFQMPVETGKVFIRIPHVWSAEFMYQVAEKISSIDSTKLKFSLNDIQGRNADETKLSVAMVTDPGKSVVLPPVNLYQIHKHKHFSTLVNYTPMPGPSFVPVSVSDPKENWLEVVQKSQERKISLELKRSPLADEDEEMKSDNKISPKEEKLVCNIVTEMTSVKLLVLPQAMKVKQDPLQFNVSDPESYNSSLCETASVVSDLTRMYVSDEEEKPEDGRRPGVKPKLHKQHSVDMEATPRKRARIQHNSIFDF